MATTTASAAYHEGNNNNHNKDDGEKPPVGPDEPLTLAHVERRLGWVDPLWHEIIRLRREGDPARIFNAFCAAGELRFCGDVLQALMRMRPYPVPANRREEPAVLACAPSAPWRSDVHPGPWECLRVEGLPDALRTAELNTCWAERIEFERPPSQAFARMLDQIALGSAAADGLRPTTTTTYPCHSGIRFPPPFAIESIPWVTLGKLSDGFDEGLMLEILQDWGLILRKAFASLPPDDEAGGGGDPRRLRKSISRATLGRTYERALLRWIVQRFAFERLA